MFNFGAMDYAGTVREEAKQACAGLRFVSPVAYLACRKKQEKRIRAARKKARKSKKGLPGLQSQGLPGLSPASSGLPGLTSGGSPGSWTPLKTFQGVAPSAQNNAVVSGAYEFFRGKGMSFKAAVSKALQSTRVPSRWRSHYTKYLTDKYQGTATPRKQQRRRRRTAARPPRRRFQASVVSETPSSVAEPLSEYAPNAATQQTAMMTPTGMDDEVYEDSFEDYPVPFYQQPAALLVGAGLLGAAIYLYGKKKKE